MTKRIKPEVQTAPAMLVIVSTPSRQISEGRAPTQTHAVVTQ